jgi:hypothetical protein
MKREIIRWIRNCLLIVALLFIGGRSSAQDIPFPFRRSDGLYGYVNTNHCWVIGPRFRGADEFSEGLARVELGGPLPEGRFQTHVEQAFIDINGEIIFSLPAVNFNRSAGNFSNGLAPAIQNDKYGFINRRGIMVINPQFENAYDFTDGLASVKLNGRWGFIDADGQMVINPLFDEVGVFNEGLAPVRRNNNWGYIDRNGHVIIDLKFRSASNFSGGLAVAQIEGRFGFINRSGNFVIAPRFDSAGGFAGEHSPRLNEELAAVRPLADGRVGFINRAGQLVIEPQFDGTYGFSEGLAAVRANGLWGFINQSGRWVIEPQFDAVMGFSQQRAPVWLAPGSASRVIDRTGRVLLDPTCNAPR